MPPAALPLEIAPHDLAAQLAAGRAPLLVDCRETWEYELVHLPGATLIPLGELAGRVDELADAAERDVVVYCHHGVRSRTGAAILRGAGLAQARSLAGGIDEWSQLIDPSLPRY